jgi:hypothetical protein
MYYKANPFEISVPISDLKPGVRVCVPKNIEHGWNRYTGLTFYQPYTIERVTPKKTKVICEDGTEFYTKDTVFLMPVREMNIENEKVVLFRKMCKVITDLDSISCRAYVASREEMKEAVDHLSAFYDFCVRNSKERGLR